MRLLVVEDEPEVQYLLTHCLKREGFEVDAVGTAADAIRLASTTPYDGILLDVRIPDGTGFGVLQTLRAAGMTAPIMCVTGCASIDDRVKGLELGADDYLCKPFALAELVARVRAMLRRRKVPDGHAPLRAADVELDVLRRTARRAGREIELTNREFDLLRFFVVNAGRPISRDEIMKEVWREKRSPELMTNVIDVYVNGLRKKLLDQGEESSRLIQTVRGLGYMLRVTGVTGVTGVAGGTGAEGPTPSSSAAEGVPA